MIFDYMPMYRAKLATMVMEEHSIRLDEIEERQEQLKKVKKGEKFRKKLNCFERLVPTMLGEVRKPYKKLLFETYGLKYSTKGTKKIGNKKQTRYKRTKFIEYKWMVQGDYVSRNVRSFPKSGLYAIHLILLISSLYYREIPIAILNMS
jgi:hypothetical protein